MVPFSPSTSNDAKPGAGVAQSAPADVSLPLLEHIAAGMPLPHALDRIIQEFEARYRGEVTGSILLLERDGRLLHAAAPNLPSVLREALHSEDARPHALFFRDAHGEAGRPVHAAELSADPRWLSHPALEAAQSQRLHGCWWSLIRHPQGAVLGVFACYLPSPREPDAADTEALSSAVRQAALAIERHQADERLRQFEGRQRQVLDSATDFAIIGTDLQFAITSWNRGAQAVFGWSESEIRGQRLHCIYTPEDIAAGRPETEMSQALREGRAADDRWHRRRNGERFWVSGELTPLRNELGQAVGYVKALRDRTRQKQDEAQLRRLNETLEDEVAQRTRERDRIWRNSPDLLAVMNGDGVLLAVNPAWTRLLGHEAADLIGSPIADYLHPDDVAASMAALAFAASEPLRHLESRYRSSAGDWRCFAWSATPEEGLIYASGRDVTAERKQAAQAHLANEARLRLALDAGEMGAWEWQIGAPHAVWVYGMDALHGLSPEQAAAARTREGYLRHVHPEDRALVDAALARTMAAANDFSAEYRILRPDGQTRWVETRARILFDEHGEPSRFSGVCMDITRRKRTEENLRFLAQASAELAGALDDGVMLQGLARLAVPTFADWCAIDLLREDGALERVATVHADAGKVQLAGQLHRLYPPDPAMPHGIWNILRSGRGEIIANMSDNLLEHAIEAPERLEAVRSLGLHSYVGVPLAAHGATMGVITFITAESGRIYGEEDLELALDLARRAATAMENGRLYKALQRSDRAKDVFLATLAHELRNPLAPIANALSLVELRGHDPELVQRSTRMIGRQVNQLARLVDDLMDLSRINTGKIELKAEPADLVAILHSAVETSRPHIEAARHALSVSIGDGPAPLLADPVRLAQVFSNLLNNAAKYTNAGGGIELRLERKPAEYAVRVRDTGIGISPSMLKTIFTIFTQVTHPVERSQGGLGIGLSLVDGLVKMHGGSVEAFSDGPGRGSEFVVRLPRTEPCREKEAAEADEKAAPAASSRILVVDDNRDAASTVAELLMLLGHEVQVAHDGLAAVAAAARMAPDVILLDIGLPGIDGYEAARRIRSGGHGGAMRLIALTGWGQAEDKERAAQAGFDEHWVKPVDLERLRTISAAKTGPGD